MPGGGQDASHLVERCLFLSAELLSADADEASLLVGLRGSLGHREREALVLLDIPRGPRLTYEAERLSQSLAADGRDVAPARSRCRLTAGGEETRASRNSLSP